MDSSLRQAVCCLKCKERAPRNAILLVCAVCLVTPWFGRAALTGVVDMSSAGITVAYFYTCFCAWKIARTGQVPGMSKPIAPNKFYDYFALAGCILSVGFLALPLDVVMTWLSPQWSTSPRSPIQIRRVT